MNGLWWFFFFSLVTFVTAVSCVFMLTPFIGLIGFDIGFWCLIGIVISVIGLGFADILGFDDD